MLMIYMNTDTWDTLSEQQRDEVFAGHDALIKAITESGEMVATEALADPATSSTVRVRGGVTEATDGPYAEAKEFFCGYYLVDCDSRERAVELAAQIPDARYTGVEVRPLMGDGGTDA
ncbi:YciI family protein [Sphaerisporangium sp. NPDC088356]|uniref:YciI family protein n=1 Tax=Sphaerisporangium sp. NPDC088356 TaxID=3154871 RepID=UPI003422B2C1